jgi:hypothetical protein
VYHSCLIRELGRSEFLPLYSNSIETLVPVTLAVTLTIALAIAIGFDPSSTLIYMPPYRYSLLSQEQHTIRLLRLLPSQGESEDVRCDLFEYTIQESDTENHLYEALSYVWGGEEKPKSILIDGQELAITQNLHTALLRLRNCRFPRIIWVDAVCIDQANNNEKELQIQLMATIYAKASRVIVWLGAAEGNSDQALDAIRIASSPRFESKRYRQTAQASIWLAELAILQLLKRPWFSRIWVRKCRFVEGSWRLIIVLDPSRSRCGSTYPNYVWYG